MSVLTTTLKFTSPTSTGSQSYTCGFTPKAILFFASYQTAEGSSVDSIWGVGMVGTTGPSQGAISASSLDNVNPFNANRISGSDRCVTIRRDETTVLIASIVSMDSNGFTLNWTTVQASAYNIYALCLGGDELTHAKVTTFTAPASASTAAVTGVGFQPDCVVMMSQGLTSDPAGGQFDIGSFGFATASAQRGVGVRREDNSTKTFVAHQATLVVSPLSTTPTYNYRGTLDSLDADGFTMTWADNPSSRYVSALCLKGGQYKVGTFNQKTSTGTNATTGVGFQPSGLLLASIDLATLAGVSATGRLSLGAASSTTSRFNIWSGVTDAANPSTNDMANASDSIIQMMTSGTPTTEAVADLDSFDADGFTLDWTTADATAREISYLAIGGTEIPTGATTNNLLLMGVG